ncbi:helix-turn-helix transcriptional regulator [Nocardioides lacusdianchii]|uniref:helix-turn-helix transcriptional regulator n=1 Tax=Nocardioides lacusdianchii TaxID=2783664 RepID=UPI001CCFF493|nr:helix-turn-helix transcriptional regulator [Nocardioides lacusdianchii]
MDDTQFGQTLKALRVGEDMRQHDLAARLGLARSTLANVETGRWAPSERLWAALSRAFPSWVDQLKPVYEAARASVRAQVADRAPFLGGPFDLLSVSYAYLFEESKSPHEIIEVRRVRAKTAGANAYGLRLAHTNAPGFRIDQQALWGGAITRSAHTSDNDGTVQWTKVDFGKSLRAGQRHEFAIRTWVERDPEPQTEVCFEMTISVRQASIHLAFNGTVQPSQVWRYGPLPDDNLIPTSPAGQRLLKLLHGTTSFTVSAPEVGQTYGVAWNWNT